MSQRACATGCGASAANQWLPLCAGCWKVWNESPELERAIAATRDRRDDEPSIRTTAIADFARRVRAERENGARP